MLSPYVWTVLEVRWSSPVDLTLIWIDMAEVLNYLERAGLGAGDVHVHPHMVLTRNHLGRASRPLGDTGMVERLDHVIPVERPGFCDGSLP